MSALVLSEPQLARVRALAAQLALVSEAPARGPHGERGRRPAPGSSRPTRVGSPIADEFRAALRAAETAQDADDVLATFEHRLDVLRRGARRTGPAPAAARRVEARRRHHRRRQWEAKIREDEDLAALVAERERRVYEDALREAREDAAVAESNTAGDAEAAEGEDDDQRSKLAEGIELLDRELGDGPRYGREVYAAAKAAGISRSTVERARRERGVRAEKGRGARWALPAERPSTLNAPSDAAA